MNVILSRLSNGGLNYDDTNLTLKEIFKSCSRKKALKLKDLYHEELTHRKIEWVKFDKIQNNFMK